MIDFRSNVRGFTVLEILIAAVLAGLLAGLAVNPMKKFIRRLEFKTSSQNIKRLIQAAQSKAMANPGIHVGAYFDLSKTPHRVVLFHDRVNPAAYQYDGPGDTPYLQPEALKAGTRFKPVGNYPDEIVFRGDGSAWKSFRIVITNGTLNDTLDVLASTGRVKVAR